MRVALGSDHAGLKLKNELASFLEQIGLDCKDFGTDSEESCDYPDIAVPIARAVADGRVDRGILVCGTGIGMSIAANKVRGVRAALCHDEFSARMARAHNDSNVLTLGARMTGAGLAREIVRVWLSTEYEGGRHAKRIAKIALLESMADERK